MSNEDEEKNVQAREKVVEPPLVDRVEGQDGHPVDTPPVLAVDNPDGQGGQGDGQPRTTSKDRMDNPVDTSGQPPDRVGTTPDNLDGQDGQPPLSRVDNPLLVAEARPLTGKNRTRWREDYRAVFGEVDELFEARVSRAMRLMENGAVRSRKEALEQIRDLPPEPNSQEARLPQLGRTYNQTWTPKRALLPLPRKTAAASSGSRLTGRCSGRSRTDS